MAEITATMVKELRERSGLPMMDCKQALTEAGGDQEKAMDLLRKRGAAAAEKKAGRTTAEGRIGSYVEKGKVAAMVEIQCETAPVASNPDFKTLASQLAKHAAISGCTDCEKICTETMADTNTTVLDALNDLINRIRENMKIARVVCGKGRCAVYVHHTGKVGVLLTVEGEGGDDELLNDICMHIAAMSPRAVSRDDVDKAVVAKEEEIAREQILASGKPANMIDKILVGKMNRWYSEQVLLEQLFVKDDKKTVGDLAKAAGVKITGFTRLQVGESK